MSSSRKARDIDAALCKKGFEKTKFGDHVRYYLYDHQTGRTLAQTKISHGESTVGAPLISQMARQLHLTKAQFLALIDCTLSEEGYREILTTQGVAG